MIIRLGVLVVALVLGLGASPAPKNSSRRAANQNSDELSAQTMRLLQTQCLACHNAEKQKGDLQLSSRMALMKGGANGPVVSPGNPDKSRLFQALLPDSDPHMPPKKQLTPAQIDLVRRWIAAGARWNEQAFAGARAPRKVALGKLPSGYQPILALALSADGTRLAVGRANRILIYDAGATNYPLVIEATGHVDAVRALAWSPDNRWLASGSFREIKVWNPATLTPVWNTSSNLLDEITALRFSPFNGVLIAADSPRAESGWVRLFTAETGKPLAAWKAHTDSIADLAIGAEGGVLATASNDKLIKLWELISQKEITQFEGHGGAVLGLAFSTNAQELVSVSTDKQLKIWDVKSGQSFVSITGKKHGFNATAWSADGKTIVAVDDNGEITAFTDIKRHSGEQSSAAANEKRLGRWPGPIHTLALNSDASRIYAGAHDGLVYALDRQGKLLAQLGAAPISPLPTTETTPLTNSPSLGKAAVPSFLHDVLPMLAKAGCSAGACHAKPDGQNGFKLSVFSYDPQSDYHEIVKESRSRRVFPAAPEESLILLKPTLAIEHGGGQRIERGSPTWTTLVRWIEGGLVYQNTNESALVRVQVEPREQSYRKGAVQPLKVLAHYADQSVRDVTALADFAANDKEIVTVDEGGRLRIGKLSGESAVVARFMGLVDSARVTVPADRTLPPDRYRRLPMNNFIDRLAYEHFQKLGLFPSAECSDAEFARRAALDLIGKLPTVDEVRLFLGDTNANKRAQWIDRLLADPAYADYWANKWADLLRPNPDRVGVKSVYVLDQWLRETFRANKPYDQFVRELLLAEGSNHRDGPIVVYRDRREPPELTTMFSQLFLGVRMECAKCHHHPNEKWSQDDFYQFAAFFGPLKHKGAGLSPPISAGTETFYYAAGGTVKHPVTEATMTPRAPDAASPVIATNADPRGALAEWLTRPDNPFFAKAAVNRVWAALFGRGFVEPVDDFRISNPASNEPLLAALAQDFADHGYDLKHLLRTILRSRVYQLSSLPNEYNLADTKNFSRSYRRRLPAEALLDAVNDLTEVPDEFSGCPPGTRAAQTWSYKIQSHFLDAFGRPNSSSDCPCERDLRTSVVQSLHLMNSKALQAKLAHADGRIKRLSGSALTPEEIITELYLAAYSRFPTPAEIRTAVTAFSAPNATRQTAGEDILWALLNAPEFVFNH